MDSSTYEIHPGKTILVVDDEPSIRDFIHRSLEKHQFIVVMATNGWDALAAFDQATFAAVILDIMMPQLDGLEVCRRIRQKSTVPIIMLTALNEEADKITALREGADDYLTKPFAVGELIARLQSVIRRANWVDVPRSVGAQRYGDLEMDFDWHRTGTGPSGFRQRLGWRDGTRIKLTPTE